jgi:ATP-dependent exoDNAse (exonuclease V) beta subunit
VKDDLLEKLKCFDDPNFIFDPRKHKYTYNDEEFISVTTFISRFHSNFDENYWSMRKSQDLGIPQEWILNDWDNIKNYANEVGTETHAWIEDYFNRRWRELPTNLDIIKRINKFNVIYAETLYKLDPLKFEVKIFSPKYKIAGMIDALFLNRGNIIILDHKTNKILTTDENMKYPEKLLYPFQDYYKTHLNEYSIQLSLYALILREWGFKVNGAYLLHIGPDDEPAKLYKCVDMTKILENYLILN